MEMLVESQVSDREMILREVEYRQMIVIDKVYLLYYSSSRDGSGEDFCVGVID